MTLLGILGMGRVQAEARMTQAWQVGTLTESTDEDFNTVQTLSAVYTGMGRLKSSTSTPAMEAVGGQFPAVQALELHLPSGTTGILKDMRAVCTACPEDAALVGRVVRISGLPASGQTTAERFPVESVNEVVQSA